MQQRIFGTDGIRDIANCGWLTSEAVLKLGKVIGFILNKTQTIFSTRIGLKKRKPLGRRLRVVIGWDSRCSGPMIENALTAGLAGLGVEVIKVGIISTPALSYLTSVNTFHLGIMISASHNSFENNGIKIFSSEGIKTPDKAEHLIEKYLSDHQWQPPLKRPPQTASVIYQPDEVRHYLNYLERVGGISLPLRGMKIVVDCANGGTSNIALEVLRNLGASVIPLHYKPNGTNINDGCGSLYPAVARKALRQHRADIALALDGDGDRVIFIDEKGNILDGDYILALLARYYKRHKGLSKNTVVTTVMSNKGLEVSLREAGIKMVRTPVGDRYVAETMFRHGYILGGEQSGHIIIRHRASTGDGLITALEVLKVMKSEDKPLSELSQCMEKYPQVLINLKVKTRPELTKLRGYQKKIKEIRRLLGPDSRLLIRYSGTEPLLRIMIEAEDKNKIKSTGDNLINFFRQHKAFR